MAERRGSRGRSGGPSLFAAAAPPQPLAARMRPESLDEFVGQAHLLAPGKALRDHGLALAAGVTLYVGMSNLVPEFRARGGWRLPVAFLAGSGVYFAARTLAGG